MKKLLFAAALLVVGYQLPAQAEMTDFGRCNEVRRGDRGEDVYELLGNFSRGYPSIGTDWGRRNFETGTVYCNRRPTRVRVLSVDSYRVVVAVPDRNRRGGGRGGRGGRWGRGDTCVIDASVRWETTRFECYSRD